jgi:hypothetical protein
MTITDHLPFLVYLTDKQAWSIAVVAPGACISKVADGEFAVPVHAAKVALRAAIAIGDEDLESRLRAACVTP